MAENKQQDGKLGGKPADRRPVGSINSCDLSVREFQEAAEGVHLRVDATCCELKERRLPAAGGRPETAGAWKAPIIEPPSDSRSHLGDTHRSNILGNLSLFLDDTNYGLDHELQ
jgi:hypothetical protein